MIHTLRVRRPNAIEEMISRGYFAVRGAVPAGVIAECQDVVWSQLAQRGIDRDDPATWTNPVIRINCPEEGPFVSAGTMPVLWELYDQLLGEGTWVKRQGMGGTIPVRFPSELDPGDAGWHIDGSYDGPDGRYWLNVQSKARGLLVLVLLTDVGECDAPTHILEGSHLDVPRLLAPAGEAGIDFARICPQLPASTFARPHALATGCAGDVYICHPFLVHRASWPHRGTRPRMVAQPGVALRQPFALVRSGAVWPVEAAILNGLD